MLKLAIYHYHYMLILMNKMFMINVNILNMAFILHILDDCLFYLLMIDLMIYNLYL